MGMPQDTDFLPEAIELLQGVQDEKLKPRRVRAARTAEQALLASDKVLHAYSAMHACLPASRCSRCVDPRNFLSCLSGTAADLLHFTMLVELGVLQVSAFGHECLEYVGRHERASIVLPYAETAY